MPKQEDGRDNALFYLEGMYQSGHWQDVILDALATKLFPTRGENRRSLLDVGKNLKFCDQPGPISSEL